MDKFLFMKSALELFAKEDFFKKLTAMVVRIISGILVIYSLVFWIKMWKTVGSMKGSDMVGGILFQLLLIIGIYMVVHVLLLRAKNIQALPKEENHMLPIGALVVKMLGEAAASFMLFAALAGGIFIWFAGKNAGMLLNSLPLIKASVTADFLGGLVFIVQTTLTAFVVILIAYAVSEAIKLFHRIEKNTR